MFWVKKENLVISFCLCDLVILRTFRWKCENSNGKKNSNKVFAVVHEQSINWVANNSRKIQNMQLVNTFVGSNNSSYSNGKENG